MQVTPRSRRARVGTFGAFFIVGFIFAMWIVNIPAVQEQTGVSHAVLGSLILLLGLGSFIAMQITGWLIDKIGSRMLVVAGIVILIVAINLPGLAQGPLLLGIALFVLGFGNGAADVAMNDQAVIVERAYPRPIMSAFHAFFSIGGALGAGLGALLQVAQVGLQMSLLIGAVISTVIAIIFLPMLLSKQETPVASPEPTPADGTRAPSRTGRLLALGLLAFLLMLSEGVASDWSALHAVDDLGQPAANASLAYAVFAVLMTIGRFSADRVSGRFGAVRVVRYGSAIAAVGMLVVVVSPAYPLTLVGWALFGIGISGIVPQIFTAAGNLGGANQGVMLARVVGAGYIGLLAGPAVIGWVSGAIGLSLAFVLPVVFCAVGIVLASSVVPRASATAPTPPRRA